MKNVGTNLVKGLWNGIKDSASWVMDKIKGFGKGILDGIKGVFGIHSPSKEMAEIGGYMSKGLANGIEDGADDVVNAGENIGDKFSESFTDSVDVSPAFENLTSKIEKQKSKLSNLEKEYKSAVMQFGAASKEAYALAKQMTTLSRDIEANELKVKDLDDGYKNLGSTLATQMRVELNNSKNRQIALKNEIDLITKKGNELARSGDISGANALRAELYKLETESERVNLNIKELTDNLDYLAKQEKKNSASNEKQLNAYEKLVETIKKQKESLEQLKTQYESAVMTEKGDEADKLADKIRKLTAEIENNQNKVDALNKSYDDTFSNKAGWQKFIDNTEDALGLSEDKLKKWTDGVGKYISKIGDYFGNAFGTVMDFVDVIAGAFDDKINAKIDKLDKELEILKERTDAELNAAKESADSQMNILNKMYDNMELSDQEYYDEKMKLQQKLTDFTNKTNAQAEAKEKKLMAEKDRLARKQFMAQQRNSIAQTLINGAQAIIKGFADLGPIAGAINAGVQSGLTAAQIASIKSQEYVPMLAKGGVADGATLAMIGEAGKEAVIPLEKNTGWMETLAEKLSEIMKKDMLSGVQPMVPAYAMAGGATVINNYYNQTINSPKALNRRELYRDSKNLLSLKG